jgi:hypothetical protein
MDMREASAMTEASGLDDGETTFSSGSSRQEGPAARIGDQLSRITMAAPLQSLLVAFLLGLFIARRR